MSRAQVHHGHRLAVGDVAADAAGAATESFGAGVEGRDEHLTGQVHATLAAADADALVAECRPGYGPAAIDRTDHIVVGHEDVVEEDFVELRSACGHLQWPDLDTLGVHVDHHRGDSLVLGGVGIGAHCCETHACDVGAAGPDLLPVHQPAPVDPGAAGLDPRRVGAGIGLAEQLAPDQVLVECRPHPASHLVLCGVLDEGEDDPAGDAVGGALDVGGGELLLHHQLFDRTCGATPRLRPMGHDVAGVDQRGALGGFVETLDALGKGPHGVADGLCLGRQVHRAGPADPGAG